MKIYNIYLTYKNIKRLREILSVFFKYGFSHLIENTELKRYIPFYKRYFKKKTSRYIEGGPEVQLRRALEELGPTFIKFGQMLSRRRDLISENLASELSKLEDSVTPVPFEEIISMERDKILKNFIKDIEKTPLASASIAQVYRAKLFDGKEIVIKIKRPSVDEILKSDIMLLSFLGNFLHRHFEEIRYVNLPLLVEEFTRIIYRELDFRNELANMIKMKKTFDDIEFIKIPEVIPLLTSENILAMEMVEAIKITDKENITKISVDIKALLLGSFKVFVKKVVEKGIYHGDLHPGNIAVTLDGKLVLYDFGNIGFLSTKIRNVIKKLFIAIVEKDYEDFIRLLLDSGIIRDDIDISMIERDLMDAFERRLELSIGAFDLSGLIKDIVDISRKHSVNLPQELVGFFRTLILLEGIGKEYIEDFSLNNLIFDIVKDADKTKEFFRESLKEVKDLKNIISSIPYRVDRILKKMANDTFTVDFVHKNLEPLIEETKRSSSRISISLVISALIVGSSIVFFSDRGPHLFGYPLLGVVGFITSMFLGIYLLISILRGGRV
ncbi:MAG: AarF/UbiB family protein [Proteobacteria bacterium]|nr:AarF/UbiB family protein [Pseudomonadota bacterium]